MWGAETQKYPTTQKNNQHNQPTEAETQKEVLTKCKSEVGRSYMDEAQREAYAKEQAMRRRREAQREGYAQKVEGRTGLPVNEALGRRRVDKPLLVQKKSTVWWGAMLTTSERQSMRKRLRESLATAASVTASAEAAEAEAQRKAAMVAAAAAAAAAASLVRAVLNAAAQPAAVLWAPVLLTEAEEASAPPVELPRAWRVWELPHDLTLQLMDDCLAKNRGWYSLALVCKATAFKYEDTQDKRDAAARDDAVRQWAAVRDTQVKQLLAGFWSKGAPTNPNPRPHPHPHPHPHPNPNPNPNPNPDPTSLHMAWNPGAPGRSAFVSVPGQELSLQHGLSAGTTGNLLLLVMMIIYAAANDKVKRSHYETFWCAHHCSP